MLRVHPLKHKQPMSTTIHRFTPPTCTLEITSRRSPLSRWTNKNILNKFQFRLRFDDPREPTAKQVTIEGNERELQQLETAIDLYVREYLSPITSKDNLESTAKFKHDRPYLTSKGLVNHELSLGSLTHNGNNHKITLSTVQLFDLMTGLEAFNSHLATLPETQARSQKNIPLWGGIAAVAISAIAIARILVRSPLQQNIASSPEARSESQTEIPELDEIFPPQKPDISEQPRSQPQLNDPLASAKRLPPPPAVDTPKPKPNIPDPADYPLPDVAQQSGLDNLSEIETTGAEQTESTIGIPAKTADSERVTSSESTVNTAEPQTTARTKTQLETTTEPELDIASNDSSALSPEEQTQSDIALNSASQPSQIQQVTAYFQEKWQPPTELKQSLEYRLILNADGSIKRVIPLGKASALYLSQTNIPVNGESFISAIPESQPATVRLLLSPNGKVQAFTE